MRKNFLLTVCVLTFLGTTNAQANGELFPDLAKRNQDKTEQVKPDKDFKLFDNNVGLNLPEEKKYKMRNNVRSAIKNINYEMEEASKEFSKFFCNENEKNL